MKGAEKFLKNGGHAGDAGILPRASFFDEALGVRDTGEDGQGEGQRGTELGRRRCTSQPREDVGAPPPGGKRRN
eukprot:CAMPEP_0194271540 /NCGR_PEP_ID=MMETSP0169-20130528/5286_1 /TAXON_ID=218684 /ORGANISM="Corethron pennatum, Strain L29A3" /LENGTH=73 /DNA_ID=CAMNT_0039013905 /DNA_START=17 /DNA_END=238 /DNA_ORIENTATION=+